MNYTVNEAFEIAKSYGVISNKKVFYRWLTEGVLHSQKHGKERSIRHEDLMDTIERKLHPFVRELLEENERLKEQLKQKNSLGRLPDGSDNFIRNSNRFLGVY